MEHNYTTSQESHFIQKKKTIAHVFKNRFMTKLIALLLTFAMLAELAPVGAVDVPGGSSEQATEELTEVLSEELSGEHEGRINAEDEESVLEAEAAESVPDAVVLGEVTELREENVKHFRMSDGSNIAVSFGSQIHYKNENDEWANIDNTLTLKKNEPLRAANLENDAEENTDMYEAVNGDQVRQFAATIDEHGFLFSAQSGEGSISLFVENEEELVTFDNNDTLQEAENLPNNQQEAENEPLGEQVDAVTENTTPIHDEGDALESNNSITAEISYPSDQYAKMSDETKQELPLSEQIQPEKLVAKVSYHNVWPDTDIVYQPNGMNVKESIILTQPKPKYEYSFRLDVAGFSANLKEDGNISVTNAEGNTVFEIPAPFMEDADGAFSDKVRYFLEEDQNGYSLSVLADPEWINAPNRVWPVIIDPTIIYCGNGSNSNILTSYVNSGRPSTPSYNNMGYLRSGYYYNTSQDEDCTGHTVGLVYINNLPEVPDGGVVTGAHLQLTQVLYGGTNNVGYHRLYSTSISNPSNPASYLSNMTWNSYLSNIYPNYTILSEEDEATAMDYSKEYFSREKKTTYAITGAAKSWYDSDDNSVSRLLVLDNGHSLTTNARVTYAGYRYGTPAYEPVLYVSYLNAVGIEDKYGYHTQDIGRAGTGYVNDFTLHTALSVPLITAPSDALPFSLSLIYNEERSNAQFTYSSSNDVHTANYSTSNVGCGWKLSVQQSIRSVELTYGNTTKTHLIYTDADGTEHYFYKDSGSTEYKDEEGLGLKITGSASSYTMKDKSGNSWIFSYGYLTEYTSSEGNKLYYAYDGVAYTFSNSTWKPTNSNSAHRVTSVWRRNKGANAYCIATLAYSGSHLSYVEDASGRKTTLGYSNSSATALTSIGFPDSKIVSYSYSLNNGYYRISEAKDNEKGYAISYVYQGGHPMRVHHFTESVKNSAGTWITGQKVNCYQYGANYSRFRYFDAGDTSTEGKLVTLHYFDNYGRTVNVVTMNAAETEVLGVSTGEYTKNSGTNAKNNRLLSAASAGVQTNNLLIDSGLESANPASSWTSSGSGSTAFVSSDNDNHPHTGNKMMKLTLSTNGLRSAYQSVYLTGGTTYVFSAFVNTLGASCFDTCETYLGFLSSSGANLGANSNRIRYYTNSDIDDGWSRLEVSYTPATSGNYRVAAMLENYIGDVLFDDFQLEAAPNNGIEEGTASSANLLQFGCFEKQIGSNTYSTADLSNWWTYDTSKAVPSDEKAHSGKYSLKLSPNMSDKQRAEQTIKINKKANQTYVLSAWGRTPQTNLYDEKEMEGNNTNQARFFGIIAKLEYADSAYNPDYYYLSFNGDISNWQYASKMIVPKQAKEHPEAIVSKITLSAALDYCANRTYIDDVSLTAEPVQTYEYDDKGNLISATESEGKTSVERDSYDRITKYTGLNGVEYHLSYPGDDTTTQNATGITCDNVVTTKNYDAGLEIYSKVKNSGSSPYLESSATLNDTKDFYASVTDANGIETSYRYNSLTGLRLKTITPNAEIVNTYYPENDRPKSTYQSGVANLTNFYDSKGNLNKIDRKTFRNGAEKHQAYEFTYNDWGQRERVAVSDGSGSDGILLASYGYDTANRLEKQGYGFDVTDTSQSGMFIKYSYDLLDRPVQKEYYNGTNKQADYHYIYNAQGDLAKQYAVNSSGRHTEEYQFEYDSLGRLIRSQEFGTGGELKQRTEHLYDTANRLKSQSWVIGDDAFSESYTYNDPGNSAATLNNGSLATMTTATGDQLVYNYDTLHRLGMVHTKNSGGTTLFYTAQNYKTISSNRSSNQISGFSYRNSSGGIINYNTYTYDSVGNISAIYQVIPNGTRCLASYEYDSQNQLTKEIRYTYSGSSLVGTATTIIYDYDTAGNLLGSYNANGVNWITYTYANDNWSDLLTSIDVNGTTRTISYSNGNPLNWYNGNTYTGLTWTQGRRLSSLSKNGTNISYTYDMEGIRSNKTVDGTTHSYITQSGRVVRETYGSNVLDFIYDTNGSPFALRYSDNNGTSFTTYYYILNIQGDVVGLINSSGATVASYAYDAWGNILTATGSMASVNPLRYRGYYYDSETGWYYLQSRYYDPKIGRFINADVLIDLKNALSYNLFAYCINNPLAFEDASGYSYGELTAGWSAGMWWLPFADLYLPIGDIVYWGGIGVCAIIDFVDTIGIDNVALLISYVVDKPKPVKVTTYSAASATNVNYFLPSWKKVKINMDHILSGHREGGNRGGPNKDRWQAWMTAEMIEKAIRQAYNSAEKASQLQYSWTNGIEMVRQLFRGSWGHGGIIEFWFNYTTSTIESAWPK